MSSPSPHVSIYHVAGLDDRERGFNRQVHIVLCEEGFQARLRYELLQIEVDPVPMEEQALQRLIQVLHEKGYRQLRTQQIFVGEHYLGNQELWIDYADPEPPPPADSLWSKWLRRIFGRSN